MDMWNFGIKEHWNKTIVLQNDYCYKKLRIMHEQLAATYSVIFQLKSRKRNAKENREKIKINTQID